MQTKNKSTDFVRFDDPLFKDARNQETFAEIIDTIEKVRLNKENEILRYYRDKGINRKSLLVDSSETEEAIKEIGKDDMNVLRRFSSKVLEKAELQRNHYQAEEIIQDNGGFKTVLYNRPLNSIGLYVPRNLPSSLIFYCETAKEAGVNEVVLALPPESNGKINPFLLAAASICNVNKIVAVGGTRAFPSLAFGLGYGVIPDKLYGPSSFYVDLVKQFLGTFYKVPIDLASGPTEIAVYIDSSTWIDQVVADLTAQLEHGPDSRYLTFTSNKEIFKVLSDALSKLPYGNSRVFQVDDPKEAFNSIDIFSPEILEIFSDSPESLKKYIHNASNTYINTSSPLGDYLVAGKGCADPTFGMARGDSGITLQSFLKTTSITSSEKGLLIPADFEMASRVASLESFKNHEAAIIKYKLWKEKQKLKN